MLYVSVAGVRAAAGKHLPVKLEKVMRDFLEESVDEKYYIKFASSPLMVSLIYILNQEGFLPESMMNNSAR